MPINFLEKRFNQTISNTIESIYERVGNCHSVERDLTQLYLDLSNYYLLERNRDYGFNLSVIRAAEVYSEFLQYLLSYSLRSAQTGRELNFARELAGELLERRFFHYASLFDLGYPRVIAWVEPDILTTVLMNLCLYESDLNIQSHLQKMATISGGATTRGFRDYLTFTDKYQASALHIACKVGNVFGVTVLTDMALEAFKSPMVPGFTQFITHRDHMGNTPLHYAAQHDDQVIANHLLKIAAQSFGSRKTQEFVGFITQTNNVGRTAVSRLAANQPNQAISSTVIPRVGIFNQGPVRLGKREIPAQTEPTQAKKAKVGG